MSHQSSNVVVPEGEAARAARRPTKRKRYGVANHWRSETLRKAMPRPHTRWFATETARMHAAAAMRKAGVTVNNKFIPLYALVEYVDR
jgi:hypothetical protein